MPITLVLYGSQFYENPQDDRAVERQYNDIIRTKSIKDLTRISNHIESELKDPKQKVSEICNQNATEENVREYLKKINEKFEVYLKENGEDQ